MDFTADKPSELVTGLFKDRESAERSYRGVSEHGYSSNEIDVVMSEQTRQRYFGDHGTLELEVGTNVSEGAAIGGAIGSTVGAIAGALAAVGTTLILPGLGIVVAGPLAAAVAGAGAGGVTSGIIGALIGWGIPKDRVEHYESGISEGGIVLGVKPRDEAEAERISRQWKENNGYHVFR